MHRYTITRFRFSPLLVLCIVLAIGVISGCADTPSPSDKNAPTQSSSKPDDFSLLFRDDFDSFDTERWKLMTHSWGGNLVLFAAETVDVSSGLLSISLKQAPEGTRFEGEKKPYLGAEVRSIASINYGRVSARAKLASGSAVVSALVTLYTPWPADNWNELDIESLGKNNNEIQFNAMVYTGPKISSSPSQSVAPTQHPSLQTLDFDSSDDFHVYTIEWTPEEALFLIDDIVYHRWTDRMKLMGLPQNILLTLWVSSAVEWAGAVTEDTINAKVVYDWVEVWRFTP